MVAVSAIGDHQRARLALARYDDPVEHQRARHIGEIIRERHSRSAQDLAVTPSPKQNVFSPILMPRLLLGGTFDVLATIGWFVTLPFITHDDLALTAREQSRG
jgi:hypothetical protein